MDAGPGLPAQTAAENLQYLGVGGCEIAGTRDEIKNVKDDGCPHVIAQKEVAISRYHQAVRCSYAMQCLLAVYECFQLLEQRCLKLT